VEFRLYRRLIRPLCMHEQRNERDAACRADLSAPAELLVLITGRARPGCYRSRGGGGWCHCDSSKDRNLQLDGQVASCLAFLRVNHPLTAPTSILSVAAAAA